MYQKSLIQSINILFSIHGELIAVIVIIFAILMFIVSVILMKKLKAPESVKLPKKCSSCTNTICKEELEEKISKTKSSDETISPDELLEFMKCEERNNGKK